MRLLVINPNISESVTDLIATEARRAASAETVIDAVTAAMGVAYIETRSEAAIGAYAALELFAEHGGDADAVVLAAFGDCRARPFFDLRDPGNLLRLDHDDAREARLRVVLVKIRRLEGDSQRAGVLAELHLDVLILFVDDGDGSAVLCGLQGSKCPRAWGDVLEQLHGCRRVRVHLFYLH